MCFCTVLRTQKKSAENTYVTGYSIGIASGQKQDDYNCCLHFLLYGVYSVFIFTSMPLTAVLIKNTAVHITTVGVICYCRRQRIFTSIYLRELSGVQEA
jgi:hypothetical protein